MNARSAPFPSRLQAFGTEDAPYTAVLDVAELPAGALRRVTRGDLDILLAHTPTGIVATDDRCPHMSAPLSIGELDGCVVACPLHDGRFDLETGNPVQMPTTGGLDPDGRYHPTWSPAGREAKVDPPGKKAEARRLTRVRRIRYYPVRIVDDRIEVALPRVPDPGAGRGWFGFPVSHDVTGGPCQMLTKRAFVNQIATDARLVGDWQYSSHSLGPSVFMAKHRHLTCRDQCPPDVHLSETRSVGSPRGRHCSLA